jgi:hypothetical protein
MNTKRTRKTISRNWPVKPKMLQDKGILRLRPKKLVDTFQQSDKPVKDKDGNSLISTEEQLKTWTEQIKEFLYLCAPKTSPAYHQQKLNYLLPVSNKILK